MASVGRGRTPLSSRLLSSSLGRLGDMRQTKNARLRACAGLKSLLCASFITMGAGIVLALVFFMSPLSDPLLAQSKAGNSSASLASLVAPRAFPDWTNCLQSLALDCWFFSSSLLGYSGTTALVVLAAQCIARRDVFGKVLILFWGVAGPRANSLLRPLVFDR